MTALSLPVRRGLIAAAVALLAAALLVAPASSASAQLVPDDAAGEIGPGVQMITNGGQCTANFVFQGGEDQGSRFSGETDEDVRPVYLGYAAHCAGTGGATATDGCAAPTPDPGEEETRVQIENATEDGILAYSSWATMQDVDEPDASTCAFNDFALVEVHPDDHELLEDDEGELDGSIPHWGGPIDDTPVEGGIPTGEAIYGYGNSQLRGGLDLLKPKAGLTLGTEGDGWNHPVYTLTPGIPGDSGSAVLSQDGEALGTLSTLAILPRVGSNGVTDLHKALDYANNPDKGGMDVELVEGDEFAGGPLDGLGLPDLGGGALPGPLG